MKKALFVLLLAATFFFAATANHYREKARRPFDVKVAVDGELLREKLAANAPKWIDEQIGSDLAQWKEKGVKKEALDALFLKKADELNLIRFMIKDRYLSFALSEKNLEAKQFRHLLAVVKKLNEEVVLPDVDFIISLEDGVGEEMDAPLFVYAKPKSVKSLVLIPDFKALTGYPRLRKEIEQANSKWPWENKAAKAFWRGSSTGGWMTEENYEEMARIKLVLLSLSYPQTLDAKLSGIVQCGSDVFEMIKKRGVLDKIVSKAEHLHYKYLVDVDGNSCSFERYFWLLLSNSLVLKQMTPNIQWYYNALKPYVHFVPVKEDLSDVMEKIEWAKGHDKEAKEIAANATQFVEEELQAEEILAYMARLLKEYGTIEGSSASSRGEATSSRGR